MSDNRCPICKDMVPNPDIVTTWADSIARNGILESELSELRLRISVPLKCGSIYVYDQDGSVKNVITMPIGELKEFIKKNLKYGVNHE